MVSNKRVPVCPDCGEPGRKIRGNHFRCSDTRCGAVWEEVGWEKRIAEEQNWIAESVKLRGIASLIVMDDIRCDICGRTMEWGEKYCFNSNKIIDDLNDGLHPIRRGKRYCRECSADAGYLRWVIHRKTGRKYLVMLVADNEELLD